jgi:hypothetical protein
VAREKGGEMTQTFYAQMNKGNNNNKKRMNNMSTRKIKIFKNDGVLGLLINVLGFFH